MSFWNSPNGNEPGHLAAGVYTLRFGRTDLYRVNPPLSRMIAAIPATYLFGIEADWLPTATDVLSYRPEYEVGSSLYFKNDPSKLHYAFAMGRLMLLPFSLLGAWTCYRFAFLLYGKTAALLALILWCFNPYILTWSATINPDITAASLGIFCFYLFGRWRHDSSWVNTFWVGGAAGLLLVSKTVWIFIFILLPILWLLAYLFTKKDKPSHLSLKSLVNLGVIFIIALVILNTFYNFSGSLKPLKQYSFISASLTGDLSKQSQSNKNRFAQSYLGEIPIPFPQDYVYGIDVQKYDFERGIPSYINGVWYEHGFWYYYLYAFFLKTPVGFQLLILVSIVASFVHKRYCSDFFSEMVLIIPFFVILILISSQTGFSVHSRYLLPLLPFLFVWTSQSALVFEEKITITKKFSWQLLLPRGIVFCFIIWGIISSLSSFPHLMSYFNEIAGGSRNGSKYLLGSDVDWGQDVYYLKQWQRKHSECRPLKITLSGTLPLEKTGIKYDGVVPKEGGDETNVFTAIKPGWYAINVNNLYGNKKEYNYLRNKKPVARAGYSIILYYFNHEEIDTQRRKFNLPTLEEEKQLAASFLEKLLENKSDIQSSRTVAIYSDKGVADDSLNKIISLLAKENFCCERITVQNIRVGNLSKYDLLIVPGGLSDEMANTLGNEGREAIRKFVHEGGGYIGICAGAYLASATFEKFLGLVNVKTNHTQEYMPRIGVMEQRQLGGAIAELEFSDEGKKLFSTNRFGNINYINGPIFIEAGRSDLQFFITLSTYRSDIYRYHFQQGTMPNTPAIVAGQFGQGNVILFSPHPELTEGMEYFLRDAARSVKK
ncbi:MAG: glycosyltransferase family 39 protein [Planctomycetaceae bacterium]|jgi:glutamine amidotransferase-like uncharacterized protein/4-amino-4-deoxy-L-arabinose transferase-like glycosyltransferase|nr:glycosyltransferase family 39 protein [Planctomycetaceae bacterium]